MRTRSRVLEKQVGNPQSFALDVVWSDPNQHPVHTGSSGNIDASYVQRSEEISDIVALRPQVYVDPVSGSWKRIKYPPSTIGKVFRPSHPCTHVKEVIHPEEDIVMTFGGNVDSGSPANERSYQYTETYKDGASLVSSLLTSPLHEVFNDSATYYTASDYLKHDWFALADSFYESCDQFIPSSFNVGEDIYESDIFREALAGIFFPTRAINRLLKFAVKHVKHAQRKNLGQISKEVLGHGVNSHLSYIFGVKPAIDDIKSLLGAHKSVSERMSILRSRAGHYVPIRVRQKLDSAFENSVPSFSMGGTSQFYLSCMDKSSYACASAFGRVREDLTFESTWTAYLQYFGINKVVGLAWELIPFSFMVDWVTNAQERINSLTRLNTGGPFTEIRNLSVSMKQSLTEGLYLTPGHRFDYGFDQLSPDSPVLIATRKSSRYERYLSFPDTSGVFDFSALGLFQYTATGSLLLQKMLAR